MNYSIFHSCIIFDTTTYYKTQVPFLSEETFTCPCKQVQLALGKEDFNDCDCKIVKLLSLILPRDSLAEYIWPVCFTIYIWAISAITFMSHISTKIICSIEPHHEKICVLLNLERTLYALGFLSRGCFRN